jgi:hypothetical protein
MFALGATATLWTQRPFESVSFERYWSDWFPYYVITGDARVISALQPDWGWRFVSVAAFLWILAVALQRTEMAAPLRPSAPRPDPAKRFFDEGVGV